MSPHSVFWLNRKEQQEEQDEEESIDVHDWNLAQQVFKSKFRPFFAPAKKTDDPF